MTIDEEKLMSTIDIDAAVAQLQEIVQCGFVVPAWKAAIETVLAENERLRMQITEFENAECIECNEIQRIDALTDERNRLVRERERLTKQLIDAGELHLADESTIFQLTHRTNPTVAKRPR